MAKERKNSRGPYKGKEPQEFEQQIVDLARVTRVMAGGKRLRFRAAVVIGDRKGRVGWAVAKGADVSLAVSKAATKARKNLLKVNLIGNTIPHQIQAKFKASKVLLKPAVEGTGIIAGGAARSVLELAGVQNVYGKILGSTSNKINNIQATFKALRSFKKVAAKIEASQDVNEDAENTEGSNLGNFEELDNKQSQILRKSGLDEALGSKNIIKIVKGK